MKKIYSPVLLRITPLRSALIATSNSGSRVYMSFGSAAADGDEGCVSGRRAMDDASDF